MNRLEVLWCKSCGRDVKWFIHRPGRLVVGFGVWGLETDWWLGLEAWCWMRRPNITMCDLTDGALFPTGWCVWPGIMFTAVQSSKKWYKYVLSVSYLLHLAATLITEGSNADVPTHSEVIQSWTEYLLQSSLNLLWTSWRLRRTTLCTALIVFANSAQWNGKINK